MGVCTDSETGRMCSCDLGFKGERCEIGEFIMFIFALLFAYTSFRTFRAEVMTLWIAQWS